MQFISWQQIGTVVDPKDEEEGSTRYIAGGDIVFTPPLARSREDMRSLKDKLEAEAKKLGLEMEITDWTSPTDALLRFKHAPQDMVQEVVDAIVAILRDELTRITPSLTVSALTVEEE